jgi:hypothetical protein
VFGTSTTYLNSDAPNIWGSGLGEFQVQNGTSSRPAVLSLGGSLNTAEALGVINFFRSGNTSGYRSRAQIASSVTSTGTANQHGGDLRFYTAADGATNPAERARIDSSGNFMVGKTAIAFVDLGGEIRANGQINSATANIDFWNAYNTTASAYRFYVTAGGTIAATSTSITAISDQRLKENIRDLDDGLDVVMALKPRKFDWKEGKGQDIKNARGFIAQEFETVLPDMIQEWKDPAPEGEQAYKAINANLIPTLVKAIQEQQALITQLQADVATLKGN